MSHTQRLIPAVLILLLLLAAAACSQPSHPSVDIRPALATAPVSDDPDDPAVWVHPSDPARSLIVGTNKVAAPAGALVVFGLDGKIRQTISGLDRPNNVDVEYGLPVGGQPTDIAVLTERLKHRLRIFKIPRDGGPLTDISSGGGAPVLAGETGERSEPMGIALYRRPRDGAVFAIVSPKTGPSQGYLGQYRLEDDGAGRVKAAPVRRFGGFSGLKEIEAVAVDDALGYVYYADEGNGIHKWRADPEHPDAGRELAHFGKTEFAADHEGIAIYARPDGTGYIVCTDQIEGNSHYHIYRREGGPGGPHDHAQMIKCVRGGADSTDGIEAVSAPLGPQFPNGLLVVMNSGPKNFLIYRWEDVASSGSPTLNAAACRRHSPNPPATSSASALTACSSSSPSAWMVISAPGVTSSSIRPSTLWPVTSRSPLVTRMVERKRFAVSMNMPAGRACSPVEFSTFTVRTVTFKSSSRGQTGPGSRGSPPRSGALASPRPGLRHRSCGLAGWRL